jgi:hypothetical protein
MIFFSVDAAAAEVKMTLKKEMHQKNKTDSQKK